MTPRDVSGPAATTMWLTDDSEKVWFDDHVRAAGEIAEFLAGDKISLSGRRVADIGCGDGIIDLALTIENQPEVLIGFDINPVDTNALLALARSMHYTQTLPRELRFERSEPEWLPAANASFDVVVTWSAFEHVQNPRALLADMARVLTPGGLLMLQLWPFYASEHGSHLWPRFPGEPFVQFARTDKEVEDRLRSDPKGQRMLGQYRSLNRITIVELQRCLLDTGFSIVKFELLTNLVRITDGLELERRYSLTDLGIGGIKLLARSNR